MALTLAGAGTRTTKRLEGHLEMAAIGFLEIAVGLEQRVQHGTEELEAERRRQQQGRDGTRVDLARAAGLQRTAVAGEQTLEHRPVGREDVLGQELAEDAPRDQADVLGIAL